MKNSQISTFTFLLLAFFIFGSSCTRTTNEGLFFGGQIINPTAPYVTLYKDNVAIDCLLLNEDNRFFKQYDSLVDGIYTLEHIPHHQSIFLEKEDSMWVRINTSAFQESAVFSGKGAPKNNFLIELELQLERENDFLAGMYSENQLVFKRIIDSLKEEKRLLWKQLDSFNAQTTFAKDITRSAYIYPYATRLERYALLRGTQWNAAEDSVFFDFRSSLDFNANDLSFFDPYINYLLNYLNQEVLDSGQNYFLAQQESEHNYKRMQLIDAAIKGEDLRNNLSRAVALEEILNFENHKLHSDFLDLYFKINSSPSYLKEVTAIHKDIDDLRIGAQLPEIELQNSSMKKVKSNLFFDGRPVVIYFWSQTEMNHYRKTIAQTRKLRQKFPQYRFIGVCIQPFNAMALQANNVMGLNAQDQFAAFEFEEISKKWVITLLNKAIVTDAQGDIIDGFANYLAPNFEEVLNN